MAGHDDARDERAHVADHRHADQVGDVDGRAERLELYGADEGQDHPEQERHQRHDRQRLETTLLDQEGQVGSPEPRLAADRAGQGL